MRAVSSRHRMTAPLRNELAIGQCLDAVILPQLSELIHYFCGMFLPASPVVFVTITRCTSATYLIKKRTKYENDDMPVIAVSAGWLFIGYRRETPYRKPVIVGTEPSPYPSTVWVIVDKVQHPRTVRTYLLSKDEPAKPGFGMIYNQGIPRDKLCFSYTELSAWLLTAGFTPPPPDYFAPTPEELNEGCEWIVRPMTRTR